MTSATFALQASRQCYSIRLTGAAALTRALCKTIMDHAKFEMWRTRRLASMRHTCKTPEDWDKLVAESRNWRYNGAFATEEALDRVFENTPELHSNDRRAMHEQYLMYAKLSFKRRRSRSFMTGDVDRLEAVNDDAEVMGEEDEDVRTRPNGLKSGKWSHIWRRISLSLAI